MTPLPGVGVRKEFRLRGARRWIGVIERADGTIELIMGRPGDSEAADRISLSGAEAAVLANLLGAPQLVARLREEHGTLGGVVTRQVPVPAASPYDGRVLGDTRMRTRTMTSIVAVMRAEQVIASPGPDLTLIAGDVLVVVGTGDGVAAAAAILMDG